jgi:hypothetical protein
MGLAAIIAAAVGIQYVNDLSKGSVTVKPAIGGGIVLIALSAVEDGIDRRIAYLMAWLILLAVLFNSGNTLGKFLSNVGGK